MQNLKNTDQWQVGSQDSENSIELMYSFRDLVMQLERIQNEKAREEISELLGKMSKVSLTSNLEESKRLLKEINLDITNVMKNFGTELRNNYYSSDVAL